MIERTCNGCDKSKLLSDFGRFVHGKFGRQPKCKECMKEVKSHAARKDLYGVSPETYAFMLQLQNEVCAICCGRPKTGDSLCVDHDHATGRVRGLLCKECNFGLGVLGDTPDRIEAAIEYLSHTLIKG